MKPTPVARSLILTFGLLLLAAPARAQSAPPEPPAPPAAPGKRGAEVAGLGAAPGTRTRRGSDPQERELTPEEEAAEAERLAEEQLRKDKQELRKSLDGPTRQGIDRIDSNLDRIVDERSRALERAPTRADPMPRSRFASPTLADRRRAMALTLEQAVRMALRSDLATLIAREQAAARALVVDQERAVLDPTLQLDVSRSRARRTRSFINPLTGLPNNSVTNQTDSLSAGASLNQTLPFGTQVTLSWDQTRSDTVGANNNPQVSLGARATATQPLLRGRGIDITLARLRNAEIDRVDAYAQLAQSYQQLILDVRAAYWAVISAETNLRVQQANLLNALKFFADSRTKKLLGAERDLGVAIAEAAVARRREAVIRAEADLENVRDQLLNRIAPSTVMPDWDVFVVPINRPTYLSPPQLDAVQALELAERRRIDLQIARRDIDRQERNLMVAENNVLPNLDLNVSTGITAVQEKYHNALRALDPPEDAFDVQAGLTLRFPLFFRAERAARQQARHTLTAARLTYKRQRTFAILEIRRAIRDMISSQERVLVNQRSVRLSEKQLQTEREANRLGQSVARNLLDAQQDLANAKLALQSSLIDYRESVARYESATGTLLDRYRAELPPEVRQVLDASRGR